MAINQETQIDIVIIAPLKGARDALLAKLPAHKKLPSTSSTGEITYRADLPITLADGWVKPYKIIIFSPLDVEQTNLFTGSVPNNMGLMAPITSQVLQRWKPAYVLLFGLAAGVPDRGIKRGDVLIAEEVIALSEAENEHSNQFTAFKVDNYLLGAARKVSSSEWLNLITESHPTRRRNIPKKVFGSIATAEKLLIEKNFLDKWPKVAGFDVESGSIVRLQSVQDAKLFMIRGVSDLFDNDKAGQSEEWERYAYDTAASFAISLLQQTHLFPDQENEVLKQNDNTESPRSTLGELFSQSFSPSFSENTQTVLRYAGLIAQEGNHLTNSTILLSAIMHLASRSDPKDTGFFLSQALEKQLEPPMDSSAFSGWITLSLLEPYGVSGFPERSGAGADEWGKCEITPELSRVIQGAHQFSQEAHPEKRLHPRHIVGVMLSPSIRPVPVIQTRLNALKFDLDHLRNEFLEFVTTNHKDDSARWRQLLLPETLTEVTPSADGLGEIEDSEGGIQPEELRVPVISEEESILPASVSDQPTNTDSLGFSPYVRAMAEFLNHERTEPPLTISIEGEWGSGKSSFMRQLRSALEAITKRQRFIKIMSHRHFVRLSRGKTPKFILRRLGPLRKYLLPREVLRELRRARCLTVEFNAWRHDKEDAMWASFALEFIRQLSGDLPRRSRLKANIKLQALRFRWKDGSIALLRAGAVGALFICLTLTLISVLYSGGIENLLADKKAASTQVAGSQGQGIELTGDSKKAVEPKLDVDQFFLRLVQASGIAGYAAIVLFLFIKLKGYLGDPLSANLKQYLESPDYSSHIAFIEHFHKDFNKIVETYAGKNKVYVFIDDLDRCEVPKAADLMQALNLMISDSPNLIFIMGMDREKVAAGLAVKYEKLLPYLAPAPPPPFLQPSTETIMDNNSQETSIVKTKPKFDPSGGMEYGYTFIEKFVQLPFRIPQPRETDLRRLLDFISPSIKKKEEEEPLEPSHILQNNMVDGSNFTPHQTEATPPLESQPEAESIIAAPSVPVDKEATPRTPDVDEVTVEKAPTIQPLTDEQKERREHFKLLAVGDSPTVRNIVLMVAPALDNNPRRLKQFINMFRLKAFIAAETGLNETLSLQQLGKFVAISLKWPRLLTNLDDNLQLLIELQAWALKPDSKESSGDMMVDYWRRQKELSQLLSYGCVDKKEGQYVPSKYSLEGVDVADLLLVSAKTDRA